ncbi:MAG: LysM peptidoglycan-binding domain-containing protein [Spirochaetota bacterium]
MNTLRYLLLILCLGAFLTPYNSYTDQIHILQKDETLYKIAHTYRISVETLLRINDIHNPHTLKVGMALKIPDQYTVVKGDTLYGIAKKYGTTVEQLLSLNNLNAGHILKAGEKLFVARVVSSVTAGIKRRAEPTDTTGTAATEPFQEMEITPKNQKTGSDGSVPFWPHDGERLLQDGKMIGTQIYGQKGDVIKSIASGQVIWSGPYRGFGRVVLIQSDDGYIYIYGGNDLISVKVGDTVKPGTVIGQLGVNPISGKPSVFFSIFKDGKPVDPEKAPRG